VIQSALPPVIMRIWLCAGRTEAPAGLPWIAGRNHSRMITGNLG
jgi:hypothetical protein